LGLSFGGESAIATGGAVGRLGAFFFVPGLGVAIARMLSGSPRHSK
jgi:hypothetical protein